MNTIAYKHSIETGNAQGREFLLFFDTFVGQFAAMNRKHTLIRIALWAALAFFASAPVWAESNTAPNAAKLSAGEQADIARIESYLNERKSVSASFLQIADNGSLRHGQIAIQRPGKMRVTYDAPDKDFMVADGTFLHIWDHEMQQQTSIPVGSGIAEFILRDTIALSGDVMVTRFMRYPAKMEVSLVSTKESGEGELTLIFEDKPLKLRQWRVLDLQGRTTGVNLENAREGVSFDSNTFVFVSPKLGQTKR